MFKLFTNRWIGRSIVFLLFIAVSALFILQKRTNDELTYMSDAAAFRESQVNTLIAVNEALLSGGNKQEIVEAAEKNSYYGMSTKDEYKQHLETETKRCFWINALSFVFSENEDLEKISIIPCSVFP